MLVAADDSSLNKFASYNELSYLIGSNYLAFSFFFVGRGNKSK